MKKSPDNVVWITEGGRDNPASRLRAFEVADILQTAVGIKNVFPPFNLTAAPRTVVLQKVCGARELDLARRLKACGTRCVYDLCDPIWLQQETNRQKAWDVDAAMSLADAVTVPTKVMQEAVKKRYPGSKVVVIPDAINLKHPDFASMRYHHSVQRLRIGWISTSLNLQHLTLVADDLRKTVAECDLILRIISTPHCGMLPPVPWVPVEFVPWRSDDCNKNLQACDIALLAVNLDEWNCGKSANRLQLCLALGIPAIFSPTPSYLELLADSPELLLTAKQPGDWRKHILKLSDPGIRNQLAGIGRKLVERKAQLENTLPLWAKTLLS